MSSALVLFLTLFVPISVYPSTIFVPDSDTALLIQLVGTEIEATAGILKILEVSSETVSTMQKVHSKALDMNTRAMQAKYYGKMLAEFPKNRDEMHSMADVRTNLYEANELYSDRNTLILGYDLLKKTNDHASKISQSNNTKTNRDRQLAMEYFQKAGISQDTAEGAVLGARASSLSALQLAGMNDAINLLNHQTLIRGDYILQKDMATMRSDYYTQKRWGIVPASLSFEEYIGVKKDSGSLHVRQL